METNFDDAIRLARATVDATSRGRPDRAEHLDNLGIQLGNRYLRTGVVKDLQEAIQAARDAVDATSPGNPARAAYLNNLGIRLGDRYSRIGDMADLDESVEIAKQVIDVTPQDHPNYIGRLHNLGLRIARVYARRGAITDLDEAIQIATRVVEIVPPNHPARATSLGTLGMRLHDRFKQTSAVKYLAEAIQCARDALEATSHDSPHRALRLSTLGEQIGDRYSLTRSLSDLEEAIQLAQDAVDATPINHTNYPAYLNNLGIQLSNRYARTGSVEEMEKAIRITREAVYITSPDHPQYMQCLQNLSAGLSDRYLRMGDIADLEEGIQISRVIISSIPNDLPGYPGVLNNVGRQLGEKFLRTGAMVDLEEAINITREVVSISPQDDAHLAEYLSHLGIRVGDRYLKTGGMSDLEEAIQIAKEAINVARKDHPDYPRYLNNLSIRLGHRFLRLGAMADIDEAIRIAKDVVNMTPYDDLSRGSRLNNLRNRLSSEYARTQVLADLEEAIKFARESVEMTPQDHPDYPGHLNNLGEGLIARFLKTGRDIDLEEAIRIARDALKMTPPDHQDRAIPLDLLGTRLGHKYFHTKVMTYLDEAINVTTEAISKTPPDHPDRSKRLNNVGKWLGNKYFKMGEMADLEAAVSNYELALNQTSSQIIDRIYAGSEAIHYLATISEWDRAFQASRITVDLIPQLSSRSLENSDKQQILSQAAGLSSIAAAVALHAGKGPVCALKLLEQGRGVMATSLQEMRIDILDLQDKHAQLASRFIQLRDEIETNFSHATPDESTRPSWETRVDQSYQASKELDVVITEIRKQPRFEDFLLSPNEEKVRQAAHYGPIAIINVSDFRCDAILVEQHQIRSIPLVITTDEIEDMVRHENLSSPEVLEWLWDTIACPILETLGFNRPPSGHTWPRMWWIPTGLMSKFPLHAAGRHRKGSWDTICDRVMSSYSASVKAIIHGRQRINESSMEDNLAVLVAMGETPGRSQLPFASDEVRMLHSICNSMKLNSVEPKRHKEDVISQLLQCKVFHFAGHGYTDDTDPSQSYLLLDDGGNSPLRVADLLEIKLRKRSPFLAYLSACGTGQIKNARFFDESIHLISAFQLAGFRHVVGTLWEVKDKLCVDVARVIYEEIMDQTLTDGTMSDDSVCRGLHRATREFRDAWLMGQDDMGEATFVEKEDVSSLESRLGVHNASKTNSMDAGLSRNAMLCNNGKEADQLYWVPYVHFGV